ncbi:hypothetical protein IMPR6_390037 [Imperialibacter sp. EC-SDR9]|nr:hypothetical protein IMPERIA75_590018 [Imperialibacter sp. 75]CAD5296718.1 hypothetical protein IMPERIA89_690018 [Imperialibacter sp. 89]VVT24193.1 hypothetical protein IMPR6_390037 [Imperialibacter sp. EC-SDR9]
MPLKKPKKPSRVEKLRGIVEATPDFDYKKVLDEERVKKHLVLRMSDDANNRQPG